MEKIIEIKDLFFEYDEGLKTIDHISFDIKKGDYVAILGHNGSGKSTIAKLLIGLLEKKGGTIIVNGIECTMSIEGTQNNCILYLSSNKELNSSVIVKSGTFLYPHGITFDSDITIFSIGTNGGFTVLDSEGNIDIDSSIEQYIDLVDLAIEKSGTSKYIICSPYGGYALRQLGVEGLYKLETALTKRYGNRHFNWRKYLIEYGLLEAGLEPTVKDLDAISKGEVPPTLLADGLHPNDAGHMVIGTYLYKMLYSLGYI